MGLAGQIELVPAIVTLRERNADIVAANPLGQIPTLLAKGEALFGSALICRYLATLSASGPALMGEGFDAMRREGVADGVLDDLIRWYSERARAADPRSADYVAVSRHKLGAAADWLEPSIVNRGAPDIGDIAVACALAYADFRFAEAEWRSGHPNLSAWFDTFGQRPSFRATVFAGQAR